MQNYVLCLRANLLEISPTVPEIPRQWRFLIFMVAALPTCAEIMDHPRTLFGGDIQTHQISS